MDFCSYRNCSVPDNPDDKRTEFEDGLNHSHSLLKPKFLHISSNEKLDKLQST